MNRKQAVDVAWAVVGVEQACVELRKLLCDGSFVHGHTVKESGFPSMDDVHGQVLIIEARVATMLRALNRKEAS